MSKPVEIPLTEDGEVVAPPRAGGGDTEEDRWPRATIGSYGMLPIGHVDGQPPQLNKTVRFRPFTTKDELEIDKLRRGVNHEAEVVLEVLSHMVTAWGEDSRFDSKSHKHRIATLRSSFMADVLAAFIMLRIEALGPDYSVRMECGRCDHGKEGTDSPWIWSADLREMQLFVANNIAGLEQEFKFRSPLKIGDHVYDVAVMAPPYWSAFTQVSPRASGLGSVKHALASAAVRRLRSTENAKAPEINFGGPMLAYVTKLDLERLAKFADSRMPRVDTLFEIECPKCGAKNVHGLTWIYDHFFGASSLPEEM